jgi:hypothetical protein
MIIIVFDVILDIEIEWGEPKSVEFWLLLTSIVLGVLWIIFVTYYASRILGPMIAFVLTRYLRWNRMIDDNSHITIDSFTIHILGGKIMLRNAAYINDDYTIRCNDAWIIFAYWNYYNGRRLGIDDMTSRLHMSINGFELHVYNQLTRYQSIARTYGLDRLLASLIDAGNRSSFMTDIKDDTKLQQNQLLSLIGRVRIDISSGRIVFGNAILPTSFVLLFENTLMNISTKLPTICIDRFRLFIDGKAENVKASFAKSPYYHVDGIIRVEPYEEPPRTMGDGFAVLQTASLHFSYEQDILGKNIFELLS